MKKVIVKTVERRNKITLWDRPKLQVWDLKKSIEIKLQLLFYSVMKSSFWKPDLNATVRNVLNQT